VSVTRNARLAALGFIFGCGTPARPPAIAPAALATESPPLPACSENTTERHFSCGQELFERRRYELAAREFRAAYQLDPRPAFVFNEAVCVEKLRDAQRAADLFEEYLRASPSTCPLLRYLQAEASPRTVQTSCFSRRGGFLRANQGSAAKPARRPPRLGPAQRPPSARSCWRSPANAEIWTARKVMVTERCGILDRLAWEHLMQRL
jgi:hypothetical protein